MVEAADAAKKVKKNVLFVIKDCEISKEFLLSLSAILTCDKKYKLLIYMCDSDSYDDATRTFCEKNEVDILIFMRPTVGFCVQSIHALVADCADGARATHTCIPVPRRDRSFKKVSDILKEEGAPSLDQRELESLTSIFDIDVKDKSITLDDRGRFEANGFQPHDIVCVPVQSISGEFDQAQTKKLVHTRFTTSNSGTVGCLLDHLKLLANKN